MTIARIPLLDFPDVVIQAEETAVKRHVQYAAAKSGDPIAASELVAELANRSVVQDLRSQLDDSVVLVAIHALESTGVNQIPAALATLLSRQIKLRHKHGRELEEWWQQKFGFDFDRLTRSEARYLENTASADTIRDRIAAAGLAVGP